MNSASSRPGPFQARQDTAAILLGLAVLAAWEFSSLDLPFVRHYGSLAGFPWRAHWLTSRVLQDGARVAGWAFFGLLLLSVWRPEWLVPKLPKRDRLWWVLTTLACLAIIPLLKRSSSTSCPWSLMEFGGDVAHYVPHWLLGQRDGGAGGCFPSGHVSTAFSLLPGWFALREHAPKVARMLLLAVLAVGLALGWVQMMRGAHYLSDSLWTAWICWTISVISCHATRAWRGGGRARRHLDPHS